MRRRYFLGLVGGAAAAWPLVAWAQQAGGMPRVLYLTGQAENDPEVRARRAAFQEGLAKLGRVDRRNIRIDYRWNVIGADPVRAALAELADSAPNVIVSGGSLISEALKLEVHTVPIVFVAVIDPLGSGLVSSMAHPGGSLTGFANYVFSMGGKWLEVLKQVAPDIKRVLAIWTPGNIGQQGFLRELETAAPAVGLQLVSAAVADAPGIEGAINRFAVVPNGGLLVLPGPPGRNYGDFIITLAARYRLPAMHTYRLSVLNGGLMSYDTDTSDLYRRAAGYVDRILRGEKPADLPVQQPTKFEFVINLKTAKALGITVPDTLLALADEVIE
jgi:putative tryptophan/tyrosine transport system substrate-binding protein